MASFFIINSGDSKLDKAVNKWLEIDRNEQTKAEVSEDVKNGNWSKLKSTMMGRQKFGTAGLRGKMAAGYKCMNDVVIIQTAQGLCSYVKKVCNHEQLEGGIVVGFDGRYNSKRFAELTAKVFASAKIRVILFSDVCPTPIVSFATLQYRCALGVMVTASHNPKEDNGYKVYWRNGSQIISPHDDNILDEIYQNLEIPEDHWNLEDLYSNPLVSDKLEEITNLYMKFIAKTLPNDVKEMNKRSAIDIAYTAMHGVGYKFIVKAFETANLKPPISVKEQQEPDPEFSTVKFPNPEETSCLERGCALAEARGARLLLANDPDADRLAVAEYDQSKKEWKIFTGNEMGALLGWWLLQQHRKTNPSTLEGVYFVASIVSSKMLKAIAHAEGAQFVETLTGFKWMGNTTIILLKEGHLPLFAFEEAIGYMCSAEVPDKDGVSAAVQVASFASQLYANGSSLNEELESLYTKYGFHVTHNAYYICHDPHVVEKIFRRLRNYDEPGEYPKSVAGCKVVSINDISADVRIPEESFCEGHLSAIGTGLDRGYTGGEMIIFRFDNGLSVTIRTSGTEPKIKYYTELVTTANTTEERERIKQDMKNTVEAFMLELLQPNQNGLK